MDDTFSLSSKFIVNMKIFLSGTDFDGEKESRRR
jgi:hypothetical protein